MKVEIALAATLIYQQIQFYKSPTQPIPRPKARYQTIDNTQILYCDTV